MYHVRYVQLIAIRTVIIPSLLSIGLLIAISIYEISTCVITRIFGGWTTYEAKLEIACLLYLYLVSYIVPYLAFMRGVETVNINCLFINSF